MAFKTYKVAVAADTDVQVAGDGAGDVPTTNRTSGIKLCFVPTSTAAVVIVAESQAQLAAGGFPLRSTDPAEADVFQGDDEFSLAPDEALWVRATEAGTLYVLVT